MNELRCLSVRQPFAWAICGNLKKIENRTWTTHFRGLVAIHASQSPQYVNELIRDLAPGTLKRDYFAYGAIIGFAEIEDIISFGPTVENDPYAFGPYCWKMKLGRFLVEPIPLKGKLNLFKISEELQAQLLQAETFELDAVADATAAMLAEEMNGEPEIEDNYYALYEEFLNTGKHVEATQVAVDRLLEINPDEPDYLMAHALVMSETNADDAAFEEAHAKYLRAIELAPDHAVANVLLGISYGVRGEWEKMIAQIDEALRLSPDSAGALFHRAQAHYELHNEVMALQDLQKCLLIDPAYPHAAEFMAELENATEMPDTPQTGK